MDSSLLFLRIVHESVPIMELAAYIIFKWRNNCAPCRCRRKTTGKKRRGPPRSCSAPSLIPLSSSWPTGWRWEHRPHPVNIWLFSLLERSKATLLVCWATLLCGQLFHLVLFIRVIIKSLKKSKRYNDILGKPSSRTCPRLADKFKMPL